MINYTYRAKRIRSRMTPEDWVHGYLTEIGKESFSDKDRFGIIEKYAIPYADGLNYNIRVTEIDPKTICRTFSYKDDIGTTIYDKDIIEFKQEDYNVLIGKDKRETRIGRTERYIIQWIDEGQEFVATPLIDGDDIYYIEGGYFHNCSHNNVSLDNIILMLIDAYGDFRLEYGGHIHIIGNAFDNPELINSK